jgi:hypothetical protein
VGCSRSTGDDWRGHLSLASGVSISSPTEAASADRESGVGEEGLAGGTRCANALVLADGVLRDELGGVVVKLPLRARFLGGETDVDTVVEGLSESSFF